MSPVSLMNQCKGAPRGHRECIESKTSDEDVWSTSHDLGQTQAMRTLLQSTTPIQIKVGIDNVDMIMKASSDSIVQQCLILFYTTVVIIQQAHLGVQQLIQARVRATHSSKI